MARRRRRREEKPKLTGRLRVRVPPEMLAELEELRRRRGARSVSEVVRQELERAGHRR